MRVRRYRYAAYGVGIVSDVPLALPRHADAALGEIEYRSADAPLWPTAKSSGFEPLLDAWHSYAALPDGTTYVRWKGVGDFLISSDGRSITGWRAAESSTESFLVYMLGQALSFALVTQGLEPLHATAVVVDESAVVFLGESGFGKSSLAACFLDAGYHLLTDDLLVIDESAGRTLAYPGPARIKLFPKVADVFLREAAACGPLNPSSSKRILPVDPARRRTMPVDLGALYVLGAPRDVCRSDRVGSEPLTRREAFIELVKSTFNRRLADAGRLQRQFDAMTRLAGRFPVRRLTYPRRIDRLPEVRDAVLRELASRPPPA